MLRVGIAGIGFMGMIHYLSYQRIEGVQVTAIQSSQAKKRAGDWTDIQGNFGRHGQQMDLANVATYSSIDDLLHDPNVDVVDICLPSNLHAQVAVEALRLGKQVFCEKPIALSLPEATTMCEAARANKRELLIGHVLPFFLEYDWALKEIKSGKHGKLLGANFKRVISDPAWLSDYWQADKMGGPMLDLHVHDAHFLLMLFGKPKSVTTRGSVRNGLAEFWDTQFEFDDTPTDTNPLSLPTRIASPTVSATCGITDQQDQPFRHGFEIQLERATLKFEFAVIGEKAEYLSPPTLIGNDGNKTLVELGKEDPTAAFDRELTQVAAILSGQTPCTGELSGELACEAVRLCEAQTQSLLTQSTVNLA